MVNGVAAAEAVTRRTGRLASLPRFVLQRGVLRPLVWRLVRVRVSGVEHLPQDGRAFVLVSNHSSHLDTPLVLGALPWRVSRRMAVAAVADYFFHKPHVALLVRAFFNAFPVERRAGRTGDPVAGPGPAPGTHRGIAAALLDAGTAVMLFPEGSRDGAVTRFTPGAAALCISRGVVCVPVGLHGAREAMPKGRSWPVPGRPPVSVAFGAPIRAREDETAAQLILRIAAAVDGLRQDGALTTAREGTDERAG